jgi:HSP20 family protein
MTLVRFNRVTPNVNFIDNVFNRSLNSHWGIDAFNATPAVNVLENENRYLIELAAPGLQKEDFSIKIENGQLIVTVEKLLKTETDSTDFKRREFGYHSFSKNFTLPENINLDSITADYTNGVLILEIPKVAPEKPIVKTIELK